MLFFHLASLSEGRKIEDQGGIKKEGQIKKVVWGGEGRGNVRVGGEREGDGAEAGAEGGEIGDLYLDMCDLRTADRPGVGGRCQAWWEGRRRRNRSTDWEGKGWHRDPTVLVPGWMTGHLRESSDRPVETHCWPPHC